MRCSLLGRLLHSVVSNLVQNALKFTRDSGLISLRARTDGKNAVLEVEECGGLQEGIETRMFEAFERGSSSRSKVGLGLAIAREAVDAHGGHIGVTDLPGKGCVFRIELPLAQPPRA